jgi:hypothetical protein
MFDSVKLYASLGYSCLPLKFGSKNPHGGLAPHGKNDATTDLAQLAEWWRECPRAGIGLLAPEGVLVLDFDQLAAEREFFATFPQLKQAPRQRTPRGGAHVFLRLPPGLPPIPASTTRLPGAHLRGMRRAYVVAAPTRVKVEGKWGRYTWEVPLVPPDQLPEVPLYLVEKLLPKPAPARPAPLPPLQHVGAVVAGELKRLAQGVYQAPVGERHNAVIRYGRAAGGLVPYGLDPEQAVQAVAQAAMANGLPEKEALEAARWAVEKGAQAPIALRTPRQRWKAALRRRLARVGGRP